MSEAKITLRFVTTWESPVSRLIRAGEYGFWASHTEAMMPEGTYLGAHFDGGVMARPSTYDAGKYGQQMFVQIPCLQVQADMFHAFLRAQVGKPYDLGAIGALVFEREWRQTDKWFCSELQAAALEHCGFFSSPLCTDNWKITPRDLLLILSGRVQVGHI